MKEHPTCTFGGCGRVHHGDDLCLTHLRQRRAGKPLTPIRTRQRRVGSCGGPECDLSVQACGYCRGHYWQFRDGRPLTPIVRDRADLRGTPCIACAEHGADRAAYTVDGLCRTHARYRASGGADWARVITLKAPNGAGHLDKDGYRIIQHDGKRRREHHVFAERELGRVLLPTEEVHHVNGNRADNTTSGPFVMDERGRLRSGNLEIWSTAQPAGQEVGPKMTWAVDLLVTYGQFDLDALRAVLAAHGDERERAAYLELSPLATAAA